MQRYLISSLALLAVLISGHTAHSHCQVPCGVYGDQLRFQSMLEDAETIAKAISEINTLSMKDDALSHNQLARWVMTKEEHASKTQKVIAEYFLTQRIKSDSDRYVEQLKAAHGVLVAAMKCKQTVDGGSAEALEKAIFDLYRAYEGKEPDFE